MKIIEIPETRDSEYVCDGCVFDKNDDCTVDAIGRFLGISIVMPCADNNTIFKIED